MRQVIICQFALFPRRIPQHRVDLRQAGLWTVPTFIVGHMSGENWDPAWRAGRDLYRDVWLVSQQAWFVAEVARRTASHPAIAACAVIGIPSDEWGETVHAALVLRPGQSVCSEEVIAHCKTLIAGYKCPRSVEFRTEPLPLSGAGKILKTVLREPHWRGREKQVN